VPGSRKRLRRPQHELRLLLMSVFHHESILSGSKHDGYQGHHKLWAEAPFGLLKEKSGALVSFKLNPQTGSAIY